MDIETTRVPTQEPDYSPSSPAARRRRYIAFLRRSLRGRCAWRYELLLGEGARPPLRHPNFAPLR